jgi:ABC-type branched-subunit amino acid transport system permease subunit
VPDIIEKNLRTLAVFAAVAAILALVPWVASSYMVSFLLLMFANIALATAWSFFSGATRYISLATAAFFGIGIYTLAITHVYIPIGFALLAAPRSDFWSRSWSGFRRCGCAACISWSSPSA